VCRTAACASTFARPSQPGRVCAVALCCASGPEVSLPLSSFLFPALFLFAALGSREVPGRLRRLLIAVVGDRRGGDGHLLAAPFQRVQRSLSACVRQRHPLPPSSITTPISYNFLSFEGNLFYSYTGRDQIVRTDRIFRSATPISSLHNDSACLG